MTTFIVKDRVLGHNPAVALYSNYYKRRWGGNRKGKIIFYDLKQKTRLHHQHKHWERNYRDYNTKIIHLWLSPDWGRHKRNHGCGCKRVANNSNRKIQRNMFPYIRTFNYLAFWDKEDNTETLVIATNKKSWKSQKK